MKASLYTRLVYNIQFLVLQSFLTNYSLKSNIKLTRFIDLISSFILFIKSKSSVLNVLLVKNKDRYQIDF